ncbi:MAG: hypothetical protein ACE5KM_13385 [Planctomycetaceae bacterium]
MTIDTSGKWWIGNEPKDIREYLEALTEDSYPISEFRLARCDCGSAAFRVEADANEGSALRTCVSCGKGHFICDSEEYWDESDPENWQCIECEADQTNVGVGFSLYDDGDDIRWISIGVRCVQCGVLGCFADWKVGYGPSLPLMDRV